MSEYVVQGENLFGWTNLKKFKYLKSAAKFCDALLKKGNFSDARVVVDNGDNWVRVYPAQKEASSII